MLLQNHVYVQFFGFWLYSWIYGVLKRLLVLCIKLKHLSILNVSKFMPVYWWYFYHEHKLQFTLITYVWPWTIVILAEILPIRHKSLSNQWISIFCLVFLFFFIYSFEEEQIHKFICCLINFLLWGTEKCFGLITKV